MAKLTREEKKALKKQKRSSFFADFKKFITRGNVVDLAVGVVVGNAFSKIVTSFTNGIVMPCIGKLMGKVSLADLKYVLTPATYVIDETTGLPTDVVKDPEVAILYGQFLQNIVDIFFRKTSVTVQYIPQEKFYNHIILLFDSFQMKTVQRNGILIQSIT